MPFSVHIDQEELAVRDLAAGLSGPSTEGPSSEGPSTGGPSTGGPSTGGPSTGGPSPGGPSTGGPAPDRRDALDPGRRGRDSRRTARGKSERDHARLGGGKSRSYAFRRS